MSNSNKLKEEAAKRGGWKFKQFDMFSDQVEPLSKIAKRLGKSVSELIREGIDLVIKKYSK